MGGYPLDYLGAKEALRPQNLIRGRETSIFYSCPFSHPILSLFPPPFYPFFPSKIFLDGVKQTPLGGPFFLHLFTHFSPQKFFLTV